MGYIIAVVAAVVILYAIYRLVNRDSKGGGAPPNSTGSGSGYGNGGKTPPEKF